MRLVRRADLPAAPWKNGGGVTYEVAVHPPGASLDGFDWRISMAEVASDGPFSAFPGIDRTLTLLEGAGLALDFAGATVALPPGAPPLSFPGEASVTGRPTNGAILDLNVMTRRNAAVHAVLPCLGQPLPPATVAVVARGAGRVGDSTLATGDVLLMDADDAANLPTGGDLLAVLILPPGPAA